VIFVSKDMSFSKGGYSEKDQISNNVLASSTRTDCLPDFSLINYSIAVYANPNFTLQAITG
jgi:hypothetical protein